MGRFLEKNQNFFRCFQNALRKWLLIQPENGCLSLLSPCTRRTPCSNKREKPLQAKLDYFFFYCSIKKPKTLENKGFRRYYLARQKGFEPPAFPLGGGRSIRLSYWRVSDDVGGKSSHAPLILPAAAAFVNAKKFLRGTSHPAPKVL